MTPRTYASPESFKTALEQRLRASAKTGTRGLVHPEQTQSAAHAVSPPLNRAANCIASCCVSADHNVSRDRV